MPTSTWGHRLRWPTRLLVTSPAPPSSGRGSPTSRPGIAEPRPVAHLGDDLRVVVVRRRLDDGPARLRAGSSLLKIPEPDEHGLGPELHHERSVRRGGDAAGTEERHRQAAGLCHLGARGRPERQVALPTRRAPLCRLESVPGCRRGSTAGACTASTMLPVPASPFERMSAAPSEIRRSASPRFVAPQTNGTVEGPLVDVVGLVCRGEHLALVHVVDLESLENLSLCEVTDPGLCHDRDGDRVLDPLDQTRDRSSARPRPGHGCRPAPVRAP